MDSDNQAISLTALEYGRADSEDPDEKAIRYLLESVVYRRKGELEKTQELLKKVIDVPTPKGAPHDEWMGRFPLDV